MEQSGEVSEPEVVVLAGNETENRREGTTETAPVTPTNTRAAELRNSSNKRKRSGLPTLAQKKDLKKLKTASPGQAATTTTPTAGGTRMNDKKKATSIAAATAASAAAKRDAAPPADPFEKMQMFMENQFRNTNENITAISASVSSLNEKCSANTQKLDEVQATSEKNKAELSALYNVIGEKDQQRRNEIFQLQEAVRRISESDQSKIEKEVQKQVEKEVTSSYARVAATPVQKGGSPTRGSVDREARYWTARRSLRLWPVPGKDKDELMDGLDHFLSEKMKIPSGVVFREDVEKVRKIPSGGRFSSVTDEVLIVFRTSMSRDTIASYSRNLGNWIDPSGKPTAGVQLDVPDHLNGVYKDLRIYGGLLRREHGQGLRRQVKFDDTKLTLYMDVKLPNSEEWLRVDRDLAIDARRENDKMSAAMTRRRLTSSTSSADGMETATETTTQERGGKRTETTIPESSTLTRFARPRPNWGKSTE